MGISPLKSLEVADDRRESEKSEGGERGGHSQQKEKMAAEPWNGCQRPMRNRDVARTTGDEHDGKERRDIKQDQHAADQPRQT